MKGVVGLGAVVGAALVFIVLIPFLWVATETPASGLPVLVSLEGVDLGVDNPHISNRRLSREQAANAYYITCASVWKAGSPRAAVIAIATALQESGLRNVAHGDAAGQSSRGLFQQKTEFYGEQVAMDPLLATGAFIERLLLVPSWESMPLTEAAAIVQRPREDLRGAYADEEPAAQVIVTLLWEPIVKLGPGACRPALVGAYALPVQQYWFEAHPEWLTAPHHDYPAVDIAVPEGTPIFAMAGGLVTASPTGGPCGAGVQVLGDDGVLYTYCHGTSPLVPAGVKVTPGQQIMVSGFTGHVSPPGPAGAHLHLQMELGASGPLVCPQAALVLLSQGKGFDPRQLPGAGCTS